MPLRLLWLSETFGSYDTICDHDGKIYGAVNYQMNNYKSSIRKYARGTKGTQWKNSNRLPY